MSLIYDKINGRFRQARIQKSINIRNSGGGNTGSLGSPPPPFSNTLPCPATLSREGGLLPQFFYLNVSFYKWSFNVLYHQTKIRLLKISCFFSSEFSSFLSFPDNGWRELSVDSHCLLKTSLFKSGDRKS